MSEKKTKKGRPYCFVSYSTREPHVQLLIDCLRIVFEPHFRVQLTPSAMESGASQRDQITKLIEKCAFAFVVLDGLRLNVVFEYGILHGNDKPVILLKEEQATVDVLSFWRNPAGLGITPVAIELDSQFSDVKDVNYTTWKRFSIQETVKVVWEQYRKKRGKISDYVEISEPKLW